MPAAGACHPVPVPVLGAADSADDDRSEPPWGPPAPGTRPRRDPITGLSTGSPAIGGAASVARRGHYMLL
jgi:hypothetical protein